MATTTFVNGVTLTDADWFNDLDRLHYDIFGDPTDINDIISSVGSISFTGAIVDICRLTIPSGWLECDGTAVSRATYADLFAALVATDSVTLSAASPGKVNWTGHGLLDYMPVKFTGTMPTELEEDKIYWISNKTINDFEVSSYPGGTSINFSGTGSGITAISAPFGDGDGSTTFNLPDFKGRSRITWGQLSWEIDLNGTHFNMTDDEITVPGNTTHLITGTPVVFTVESGDSITGLTTTNTYYIIRVDETTINLASSLANAAAGTAIDISGTIDSADLYKLTYTGTLRGYGEVGGEEEHPMSLTELLAHTHTMVVGNNADFVPLGGAFGTNGTGDTETTASRGGNAAMNIMQPYLAVRTIIKT